MIESCQTHLPSWAFWRHLIWMTMRLSEHTSSGRLMPTLMWAQAEASMPWQSSTTRTRL